MLAVGQFRANPIRAILFAILNLGSAQNPHVLRVRSGSCALSVFKLKLTATITPTGISSSPPILPLFICPYFLCVFLLSVTGFFPAL
ncbi:hypothetical protein CRN75_01745 [Yersinia frederiksenii]|nr:hypothetical protein CRN75_01745 [Yersinia frederiksenii]